MNELKHFLLKNNVERNCYKKFFLVETVMTIIYKILENSQSQIFYIKFTEYFLHSSTLHFQT